MMQFQIETTQGMANAYQRMAEVIIRDGLPVFLAIVPGGDGFMLAVHLEMPGKAVMVRDTDDSLVILHALGGRDDPLVIAIQGIIDATGNYAPAIEL